MIRFLLMIFSFFIVVNNTVYAAKEVVIDNQSGEQVKITVDGYSTTSGGGWMQRCYPAAGAWHKMERGDIFTYRPEGACKEVYKLQVRYDWWGEQRTCPMSVYVLKNIIRKDGGCHAGS